MPAKITWLGHACIRIESGSHRILIDPFLSGQPAPPVDVDALDADFILVSHGHFDHVGDAAAIARRTGATVIGPFEVCSWLQKQGVAQTAGQNTGGAHDYPFGRVKLTVAHHSSTMPDGSSGGSPCGFWISLAGGPRIYDAADTALFGDMRLIGEEGIDLAILPIGDQFTMGPADALRAVKLLNPKRVLPIHYNTWDLIAQDAQAWAQRVRAETSAEPVILEPGGSLSL